MGMEDPSASVTVCEDGPLLLRGRFTLLTQDGAVVDPGRATVALCRCGRSAIKPFCDGTHKVVGFQAPSAPTGERPLSGEATGSGDATSED
jgi:CDGSH-type Zn-finger protein